MEEGRLWKDSLKFVGLESQAWLFSRVEKCKECIRLNHSREVALLVYLCIFGLELRDFVAFVLLSNNASAFEDGYVLWFPAERTRRKTLLERPRYTKGIHMSVFHTGSNPLIFTLLDSFHNQMWE
jgi:hypothetical protein